MLMLCLKCYSANIKLCDKITLKNNKFAAFYLNNSSKLMININIYYKLNTKAKDRIAVSLTLVNRNDQTTKK
jgi:hypothetical protein